MSGRRRMSSRVGSVVVIGAMAAVCLAAPAARADDEKPSVESVLRKTADLYRKAKSFSVAVDRTQTLGAPEVESALEAAFRKPDRMMVKLSDSGSRFELVIDGKSMYTLVGPLKQYTQAKAPASLDALAGENVVLGILQGTMLAELAADDPYAKLMEGVTASSYVGQDELGGSKTHHLRFVQEQFDWELWVSAEGDPVVRQAVLDLTKSVAGSPLAEQLKGKKLTITARFKDWKIGARLDDSLFAFDPPKDAKKVDTFGPEGAGEEEAGPALLVGKPAPEIHLEELGKGEFRLSEQRGKHPVMIDFWATWCGPCVQEMPILAKIAKTYEKKGLVFRAVNLREDRDQIKAFLKDKGLDVPVALDADGKASDAFQVEGIPTLVLIDAQGKVQAVHVGFDPSLEKTLPKELDDLIAGKDLAGKDERDEPKDDDPTP